MRDFPEGLSVSQIQRELANRLDLRAKSLGQALGSVPGINPVRYKLRQLRKFGCVDYVFSGRTKIWFLPEKKKQQGEIKYANSIGTASKNKPGQSRRAEGHL
jgi:hypothetical protein